MNIDILKKFNPRPDKIKIINEMTTEKLNSWIIVNNNRLKNNIKYNIEFTIDDKTCNSSHPYYSIIGDQVQYRRISTKEELVQFIDSNNYHKAYNNSPFTNSPWVYNEESFYKSYPDFDLTYYKNRYRKNISETSLDTLIHYHTIGRLNRHAINNKKNISFLLSIVFT